MNFKKASGRILSRYLKEMDHKPRSEDRGLPIVRTQCLSKNKTMLIVEDYIAIIWVGESRTNEIRDNSMGKLYRKA